MFCEADAAGDEATGVERKATMDGGDIGSFKSCVIGSCNLCWRKTCTSFSPPSSHSPFLQFLFTSSLFLSSVLPFFLPFLFSFSLLSPSFLLHSLSIFIPSFSLPSLFPQPFMYINGADAIQTTIAVIDNVLDHLSSPPEPSNIS